MAGPGYGYYVAWVTLSLLDAGLAQVKGRGGLWWFLMSLGLGPLATLIIVLPPPSWPGGSTTRRAPSDRAPAIADDPGAS